MTLYEMLSPTALSVTDAGPLKAAPTSNMSSVAKDPSAIEPGGVRKGGFELGLLKMGNRRGFFNALVSKNSRNFVYVLYRVCRDIRSILKSGTLAHLGTW